MTRGPWMYLVVAGLLFVLAVSFASSRPWEETGARNAIAPNTLAGLTACGFAIAGGLALIAAALVERPPRDPRP